MAKLYRDWGLCSQEEDFHWAADQYMHTSPPGWTGVMGLLEGGAHKYPTSRSYLLPAYCNSGPDNPRPGRQPFQTRTHVLAQHLKPGLNVAFPPCCKERIPGIRSLKEECSSPGTQLIFLHLGLFVLSIQASWSPLAPQRVLCGRPGIGSPQILNRDRLCCLQVSPSFNICHVVSIAHSKP